ncbi:hypothetical protein VHUM_04314 [Vanrija humicola]|uniref:Uncharacterized protein n=1 Tax=Vanrija humicola TaxID=5417 RepID=A0A7D8UX19_VANHU|nr:hypothetical protein VHUM_04314 [Vanrija humicola]
MLSSAPAIPLQSIDFLNGGNGRRLSLVAANGREFLTNRDGLPSPGVLTPIEGHTPADTPPESATPSETGTPPQQHDRRKSMFQDVDDGGSIRKVPSRGGIWHDNVSDVFLLCVFLLSSVAVAPLRVGGFRIRCCSCCWLVLVPSRR